VEIEHELRFEASLVLGRTFITAHRKSPKNPSPVFVWPGYQIVSVRIATIRVPSGQLAFVHAFMKARILLADDFPPFTELVKGIVEPEFDFVGTAVNGRALITAALALDPDVIIADISMPILSGIDAVRKLRQLRSRAIVLFLTIHAEADFVRLCFAEGAKGFVVKSQLDTELLHAIREVLAGRIYVSATAERLY
jgi:CheY-like chemotaxis protein